MLRPSIGVLLAALACLAPGAKAIAADAKLSAAVNSLFASGWKQSATALSAAQPHYARAQAAATADPRPAYAMALIAIKNSKHSEAHKWLDEALSRDKQDLASRRAKVWVDLLTRQYAAGLSGMQAAAESAAAKDSDASPAEQQALAGSLGRMMGYLLAAAPSSVSVGELATKEQDLLGSLPRAMHVAFLEGKGQAVEKFEQMKAELEKQQDTAVEEQTEQQNLAKKKLDENRTEVAYAQEALKTEAQKAKDKYDKEEGLLNKDMAPLAARLKTLDARARDLKNYLVNTDREVERLVGSASLARGRDPQREASMLREADRLKFQSRGARDEFLRVDSEMAQVRSQGVALEGKLREAQAWLQGEMRRLGVEGSKLVKAEKGLKAVERKVSEPVTGANSRVRVTATRLSSLSTYEEFPLDAEKQRVLDSLR